MYQPMGPMLRTAFAEGYAVLAVNALNLETAKTIIDTASEVSSPIIIDLYDGLLATHLSAEVVFPGIRQLAQDAAVPVAICLDHGNQERRVRRAIHLGFTSAMMDASREPFEDNVRTVASVVKFAAAYGASIEGEVGGMGAVLGGEFTTEAMMTNPEEAAEFVARTGVDALAISYGSSHGLLPAGFTPKLDFERLAAINEKCRMPLVLHGGSGTSHDELVQSVANGIAKVNMGAHFMNANVIGFVNAYRDQPGAELFELLKAASQNASEVILSYLEPCGSIGKAR